jgi:RNA polymerase-interacting CarD/CdnL/TRCF family regulator
MLDTARSLLVKEISLAKKVAEKQIEKDLDKMFPATSAQASTV